MLTIEAHGKSYRINDPGGLIGKALQNGNPYEAPVLEYIFQKGYEGVAIDVGASVGNHSLWLAAVCGLDVVAFEPLDYERLQENVNLNPELLIKTHERALGDGGEAKEFRDAPAHVTGRPTTKAGVIEAVAQMATTRLDDILYPILGPISLMKVDVEGMEPDVLRGAIVTISNFRPDIFAEAEDSEAHDKVAEVLEPFGYKHINTYGATPLEEWTCSQ